MIRTAYDHAALIDSSAVIALLDPKEQFHSEAVRLYSTNRELTWAALDVTSHEVFTRIRYDSSITRAREHYDFLRSSYGVQLHRFVPTDEVDALGIAAKYSSRKLSFHDALCAAVMKRLGIVKVFTLDSDFAVLGFVTLPGGTG